MSPLSGTTDRSYKNALQPFLQSRTRVRVLPASDHRSELLVRQKDGYLGGPSTPSGAAVRGWHPGTGQLSRPWPMHVHTADRHVYPQNTSNSSRATSSAGLTHFNTDFVIIAHFIFHPESNIQSPLGYTSTITARAWMGSVILMCPFCQRRFCIRIDRNGRLELTDTASSAILDVLHVKDEYWYDLCNGCTHRCPGGFTGLIIRVMSSTD